MLRVNGGPAHSGTVIKRERGGKWEHICGVRRVELAGYWASCPDCGEKRP